MAILVRNDDGRRWSPPADALVGRSPSCTLQIDASDISKEHASLRWRESGWEVRDLNSRNGTFVAGQRLGPRHLGRLTPGSTVRFGGSSTWQVEDASPPPPMARKVPDGKWVVATTRLLALPPGEEPFATVHRDELGHWLLEHDGEVRNATHGEQIELAGDRWQLFLPTPSEATTDPLDPAWSINAAALTLYADEGQPKPRRVVLATPAGDNELAAKSFHCVTLALARARLRDTAEGKPAEACGWLDPRALMAELNTKRTHFNVLVYRVRQQLDDAGLTDAARSIERRADGHLRLCIARIEVVAGST